MTVVLTLLVFQAIFLVRNVLILALVAAFLAVGLDPVVRKLDRGRLSRGQVVAGIFLVIVLFLGGFFAAVVPPLVRQISSFATNVPGYVEDLGENNPRLASFLEDNNISEKIKQTAGDVPDMIGGSFSKVLGIAGSVMSAFFNGVTVIVLTIYFLLSLGNLRDGTLKLVPASQRDRVGELLDPILEKVGGYVAGNIFISLIAGTLAFIFLTIAGVPFPVALALWVAIADLIPLVGATLGAVPATIVAFFASTGLGIITLVYFLIYQQVENYVVAPKIMTRAVDVSPAAVLLSALIGASLLGFVGALMAIPFAAAIKLIAQEVIIPRADAH